MISRHRQHTSSPGAHAAAWGIVGRATSSSIVGNGRSGTRPRISGRDPPPSTLCSLFQCPSSETSEADKAATRVNRAPFKYWPSATRRRPSHANRRVVSAPLPPVRAAASPRGVVVVDRRRDIRARPVSGSKRQAMRRNRPDLDSLKRWRAP